MKPEILSLEPKKVSFHGRNNILLRGRNLESVIKIRIQGNLDCVSKEFPVFNRSSDTLRFHIPPSATKGTVKVSVVTPDDRCHGNSIITYSSQPSCTGIQPNVTWSSGGRKIHVQGSNMELVESVTVLPSNKVLKTQYDTSSGDVWFYSHSYDGSGLFRLLLNVHNSVVDCVDYLSYNRDPEFTEFTTLQVANDLQVNIQKKADMLNLSMNEVTVMGVQGDQQYQCILEKIESSAIICKIKGKPGAVPVVDSLTITVGNYVLGMSSANFDSDIKDFIVGNSKLFALTNHRLHQMRHDLKEEKRKDITKVNILVPFDTNGTLITCGTFKDGYCEVLDINDITNSIYYESNILLGPRQDEKSLAFIADRYLLVGKKDDDAKAQDTVYSVVTLWNTLQSQPGDIFSKIAEESYAIIQSTVRDVEFVNGFQRVSSSESYLFLNAKTDYKRKVLVLRMNSSKEKKRDIIKSLQAATIRCCSDKVHPVLVASTVIPSANGIIWAGVFSAQKDSENSALALYNISNVQGRVKGFCPIGDRPCGFELVLDEKFTPGCPTVLYKSDNERAVFPKMHFDPVDFKHIYIALKNQLRRVSVVSCAKYNTLKDCRAALDPLCGWCVNKHRCSTQNECSNTSWVSIPKNSLQTQLLSFHMAENSSSEITLHLALSLESTGNPVFSCAFTKDGVNLCDGSEPPAAFPNCSCSFSDQLLHTEGLRVSATVTIEDQKITETLTLTNCFSITDNLPNSSYTQCVQCFSAGCHWFSSSECFDWTHGSRPQLHIQKPEILSLEPKKVSFHGRNNILLRGRNLESVTKIRIQGNLDCISKESPVFDRSSDTLRFHIPPSATKGTVKVCVVTPDDRCHGNSIITYSSQPSCTGIQPNVTWSSGGRKIHVQGSNMELVESVTVLPSNKDAWFHSHSYDGSGLFRLLLNVQNSFVDCVDDFSYNRDPEFTEFTTLQVANDLQVNIQKKADMLNLSMNEVTVMGVQGDQQYQCILEKIESYVIICTIKGEPGAVPVVDSLTITVGNYVLGMSSAKYLFCLSSQNITGHEPEIFSLEPNKASFHGRNNVLLRGRDLENVTKIRIQGNPNCISKE
ncbi:plexin-C1-like protein [Labeo rohita]|uniref:Plexin-C1-like protein n=1 Tax=Labeo rohita TaxID=84645 RepID=A0A498M9Q1_LABRO|nr:plexin-C1-like protein [Labeo rohita]